MALDPSLITDVMSRWQGPQLPDPIERAAKLQALRSGVLQQQAAAQNLQTGALELQQRQQEIAGQKALSDAIRDNMTAGPNGLPVINHAGVATALGSGGFGNLIPKYQEGVATQQKTQADALKLQMENQATMLDQASRYFADANDQPSWDGAIAHAVGLGADPAKLGIPPIYSPEAKQKVQDMALTTKDRLAATAAQMDAKAKADAQTLASEKERDGIRRRCGEGLVEAGRGQSGHGRPGTAATPFRRHAAIHRRYRTAVPEAAYRYRRRSGAHLTQRARCRSAGKGRARRPGDSEAHRSDYGTLRRG
jgi:hypothetical protein